jgi:DNA-binding MarR family transcriptional regulator
MPTRESVLYEGIRLVRPLHRHVYKAVESTLAEEGGGITVATRAVLERLHEAGPETVPQTARALAFPRQVIQRLVDDLIARGLAGRSPNPAHRRSPLIRLTASGAATMCRVLDREAAVLREIAAPLADADIATFRAVMAYLTDSFARRAPIDGDGVLESVDRDAAGAERAGD